MKTQWLKQNNRENVILFFSGWGMDEMPFNHINAINYDVLIFHSYECFNITQQQISEISQYKNISVIGWSMGVWAAENILSKIPCKVNTGVAINGTLTPIDENYGVSPYWFAKTIENLSEESMRKFYLRMCRKKDVLKYFLQVKPKRELRSLKDELSLLYCTAKNISCVKNTIFSQAIISESDYVVPTKSQKLSWDKEGIDISYTDEPHYLFAEYVSWDQFFI